MDKKIHVTIWSEFTHEKTDPEAKAMYPDGLHRQIANYLGKTADFEVTTVALDDPDQGLPEWLLNRTDVLVWWGHIRHGDVDDALVERIIQRILRKGMGFIALHSAHHSKIFKRIIGATGNLCWGKEQSEIVWNMAPSHPIAAGIPDHFVLKKEELYGEPFYIPQPNELVFGSWFEDGHIMRSGCCFLRGVGKIFYFQPGHETCPSYYNEYVLRIIRNAVYWAKPNDFGFDTTTENGIEVLTPITDELK